MDLSSVRDAQRHARLRDMMVTKIAKMVEKGTNRQTLVNKQRRQRDDGLGGALGVLTDQEVAFVRNEVDRLINTGDATEASLNRVAMHVRMAANEPSAGTSKPRHHVHDNTTGAKESAQKGFQLPSLNASKNAPQLTPALLASKKEFYAESDPDPWTLMNAKDKEDYSREIIDQRRAAKKKEAEQRDFLDKQVRERSEAKKQMLELERDRAKEDQRQVNAWEEQEKKAKETLRQKAEAEKRMFDEQLALSKIRKSKEEQQRREEEQRIAADIQKGIVEEKRVAVERKQAIREEMAKFAETNFSNKDQYRIQKAKAAEEDARLQQAFLDRLAKEEKAREDNLIKLHERMTRQMEMAHTIQKTMKEKSSEDEKKAALYASEKEAKELAAEKAAAERSAQDKMRLRQALALQVLERDEKTAKQKTDDLAFKSLFKKEVEEAQRAEIERRIAEKQRVQRQRDLLDAQMALRSTQKRVIMSEAERQLNAKRLEEVSKPRSRD